MKYAILLLIAFCAIVTAKEVESKRDILDTLVDGLKEIYDKVLFPAINNQAKNLALLAAQVLAGISQTGISGLDNIVGKRDTPSFFSQLFDELKKGLLPKLDETVKSLALTAATVLAQISEKGIGRRDILDTFTDGLKEIYDKVLFPALNNQAKNLALLAAQVLAGISQTGISGLDDAIGKRDIFDFFEELGNKIIAGVLPKLDETVKNLALQAATALVNISEKGIGK